MSDSRLQSYQNAFSLASYDDQTFNLAILKRLQK